MAGGRYSVELTSRAKRELASLPIATQRRLRTAIDAPELDPRPPRSKRLAGSSPRPIWRIRVGDYRVLYAIDDDRLLVLVIRVGHRRDIYRGR